MRKSPSDTRPERRPLRIFAFDPMVSRAGDHRVTVEIPYKDIAWEQRAFRDDRLEVVDYDAATERYFRAVNLDEGQIAMTQGLEPLEHDPQFHQQMVYAVASKVLENFDRALGRRFRFLGGERLRLFPHAFQARNAYFDWQLNAVLFGYFSADDDDPGPNLPGQTIFTCLSHDIVAHEVAHGALNRLHRYYSEPTNPHVPALHEAFADLVAMFQRLTFPEVVAPALRESRGNLLDPGNRLLDIGAQFGSAAGKGAPLRRIVSTKPDPQLFAQTREPHDLGWILVSAVYEGFAATFERRTRDLVRIATGGSGRLPEGDLHPDLVERLTAECVRTAQSVLTMCIRATDYLPPVDPTFSDFLRAMITADFELNRADVVGLRAAMIEAFRQRGIHPEAVGSLAVPSLLLEPEDPAAQPDGELARIVADLARIGAQQLGRTYARPGRDASKATVRRQPAKIDALKQSPVQMSRHLEALEVPEELEVDASEVLPPPEDERGSYDDPSIAPRLGAWAKQNRDCLGLRNDLPVRLLGYHPVHRVASGGELLVEMVATFVQTPRSSSQPKDLGGLKYRAGVTLVANIDGQVRYVIRKPLHDDRLKRMKEWVEYFDTEMGFGGGWALRTPPSNRMMDAFSARAMDRRRWR